MDAQNHIEGKPAEKAGGGLDEDCAFFKYIPIEQAPQWEAIGWVTSPLYPPHSDFSVLGRWAGDGPMVLPE